MVANSRPSILACILAIGIVTCPVGTAQAQCTTGDAVTSFCYVTGGAMTKQACFKQLKWSAYTPSQPATRGCAPILNQMSANVSYCGYITGQRRLHASRPLSLTGPGSCQVSCDCGVLSIDNSDGLPVELKGFEIE